MKGDGWLGGKLSTQARNTVEWHVKNKKDNYDRYSFDGVVEWWRNKASKRYESLKADGRLRTELETWNCADDIEIIR